MTISRGSREALLGPDPLSAALDGPGGSQHSARPSATWSCCSVDLPGENYGKSMGKPWEELWGNLDENLMNVHSFVRLSSYFCDTA